jgi:hypothetical protein
MTTIAATNASATNGSYISAHLNLIACGDIPMTEPNYEEEYQAPRAPFMNLTKEERAVKSERFKFGLCCDCDNGLGDKSDFVSHPRPNGAFVMMCNECNYYHITQFETFVGGEHGGCN